MLKFPIQQNCSAEVMLRAPNKESICCVMHMCINKLKQIKVPFSVSHKVTLTYLSQQQGWPF